MTPSWRNAARLLRRRSPTTDAGNPASVSGAQARSSRSRAEDAGWLLLACVALLAPIWLPPVLPTTDGPSHAYNAFVQWALRAGEQPYPQMYVSRHAFGPNLTATVLLSFLGQLLGWAAGERVLVTLAIVGACAVFLALCRVRLAERTGALVALAGICAWLAQSWFVWSGFYDFALSLVLFGVLVLVLVRSSGAARALGACLLLCALYCTHLFTYAVATGLVLWLVLLDAWAGRERAWNLVAAGLALALLPLAARLGGTGGGGIDWHGKAKALAGLVLGDFVLTAHPLDVLAGVLIMGAVWYTLARALRGGAAQENPVIRRLIVFSAGVLLFSLVAPERFHEGSYIGSRLRILAVVALLPALAATLTSRPTWLLTWGGRVLMALLAAHGALFLRASERLAGDTTAIEGLLRSAGARPGSMVAGQLADVEGGLFRISAYAHLDDRIALRNRYLVLDNYEASLAIFRVQWKADPDFARFRGDGGGWSVSVSPGAIVWPGNALFVVHERARRLRADGRCVALDRPVLGEAYAVTPVRLVCRPPAERRPG